MRRAIDALFALRPLHLVPALALYGAGAAWGRRAGAAARARDAGWDWGAFTFPLLALCFLLAAVHAANSWRDRNGDAENRKGMSVTHGLVGRRDLTRAGAASAALAALFALLPPVPPPARALLLLAAALGAAYVAPGLALKEKPWLDLASHAVGYGVVAFLLGASAVHALAEDTAIAWRTGLAAAIPYAAGIATVSILTMIADAPGDLAAGQRTTATRLGWERSMILARLLAWGAALTGLLAAEAVPALWGLAAAAWLALGDWAGAASAEACETPDGGAEDSAPSEMNRLAILLQLLFLALLAARAPWTGVAALLIGAAVTVYNRVRFGNGYPLARLRAGGRAALRRGRP